MGTRLIILSLLCYSCLFSVYITVAVRLTCHKYLFLWLFQKSLTSVFIAFGYGELVWGHYKATHRFII